MSNIIFLLLQISIVVLGALSICFAVHHFQKKRYFWFGFWVMMTFHNVITLAEVLFKF